MQAWARAATITIAATLAVLTHGGGARAGEEATHTGRTDTRRVTRIEIRKAAHTMRLLAGETVVAKYTVALGPGGAGPKTHEGDMVTPVGRYHVVSHAPSQFHIFLRLDYPNADDRARFAKLRANGSLPKKATIGGDVGIHGAPAQAAWKKRHKEVDWTAGCIAVDDEEIEEVARLVKDGTEVDIQD